MPIRKVDNSSRIKLSAIIFTIFAWSTQETSTCDEQMPFEGFGIFLGSIVHLNISEAGTEERVMEKVYHDLGIR